MDYIDFMIFKAIALVVAAFIYGFWSDFTARRRLERRTKDRVGSDTSQATDATEAH